MKSSEFNEALQALQELKELKETVYWTEGYDLITSSEATVADEALMGLHRTIRDIKKLFPEESKVIPEYDALDIPNEADYEELPDDAPDEEKEEHYVNFIEDCAEKYDSLIDNWIERVERFLDLFQDFTL